ncbi:putative pentatricopeptide repeat-containing protein [Tanacetum coccineum]
MISHDTTVTNHHHHHRPPPPHSHNLYSECDNKLDSTMKVFSRIGERTVVSWKMIASACGDNGNFVDLLNLFGEMLEEGKLRR